MTTKRITIAGGGLGGALMAKYLGLAGHQVALFERRPDIRDVEIVRGGDDTGTRPGTILRSGRDTETVTVPGGGA